jgi:quercetin dioxygenase-like cupin family protein
MYTLNKEIAAKDLGNGVTRKVLSYSDNIMSVELRFRKGAIGELHKHPHEQIGYIVSGSLQLLGGQEPVTLNTGDTYYIPTGEEHGVIALEDTVLLDIFTPMRNDFI